jgi:hypothetical protein
VSCLRSMRSMRWLRRSALGCPASLRRDSPTSAPGLSHVRPGTGVPHPLRRILRRKRLLRLLPLAACRSPRCCVVSQPINQSAPNRAAKPQAACHCGNARVGLRVSAGPLRVAPQPRR